MNITSITRGYRRSIAIKTPDGREMWLAHEQTVTATIEEGDPLLEVEATLHENCKRAVNASLKEEKEKIMAVKKPASDEPFPGKMPSSKVNSMQQLN